MAWKGLIRFTRRASSAPRFTSRTRAGYSQNEEKRVKRVVHRTLRSVQNNILAGILTIGHLFVT